MRNFIHPRVIIWPLVVLGLFIIGMVLGWYTYLPWLDIPTHILGGAAIALSAFYYLEEEKVSVNKYILAALMFGGAATAAVFWEFQEFLLDTIFLTETQPSTVDTMKDLADGLLGATIAIIIKASGK